MATFNSPYLPPDDPDQGRPVTIIDSREVPHVFTPEVDPWTLLTITFEDGDKETVKVWTEEVEQ